MNIVEVSASNLLPFTARVYK